MNDLQPTFLLERNPVTHARHRREVLWQVTVPAVAGLVIVVAMATLAIVLGTSQEVSQWADTSLILLILPTMIFALIILILLAAFIFGVVRLIQVLPPYARRVQDFFVMLGVQIGQLDDKIVEPILRAQAFSASTKAFRRQFRRRK